MPGRQDARTAGRQDGRTAGCQDGGSPGRQDANTARPGRTGRPPERTRVYKMTEMSEFRRPAPSMLDHVGVRGMLDDDILGIDGTRLREATLGTDAGQACAVVTSGLDEPDTSDRGEEKPTCVGRILIGMKELCRDNGLDEAVTAELVGRLATDLCRRNPPI